MPNRLRSPKGFTFVESLITFSIVGIFLALTWATVNFLLEKANDQITKTRAHFLAVEGIELTKQIKMTAVNRDREQGFFESIGNKAGDFVLEKNGDAYSLKEGQNEQIEMTEEPYTTYCRTIRISGQDERSRQVEAEVRWGDALDCSKGDEMIAYSTYLADLTHENPGS